MGGHIVLLGDSIFDNGSYVPGKPDVVQQLQAMVSADWKATLLAVDGAVVQSVARQIMKLSTTTTHLVISAGGNAALGYQDLLKDRSHVAADGFSQLAVAQQTFRDDYAAMVDLAVETGRAVVLCTIYDAVPGLPPQAVTALSIFNDVIIREASRCKLPVLDFRSICSDSEDYSSLSPIEPSAIGGSKIASAVANLIATHDFSFQHTVIYGKQSR
jgi:hypothetical protein